MIVADFIQCYKFFITLLFMSGIEVLVKKESKSYRNFVAFVISILFHFTKNAIMILIFYFKIIQWRIKAMKIINIRLQLIEFLRINKLKTMCEV